MSEKNDDLPILRADEISDILKHIEADIEFLVMDACGGGAIVKRNLIENKSVIAMKMADIILDEIVGVI